MWLVIDYMSLQEIPLKHDRGVHWSVPCASSTVSIEARRRTKIDPISPLNANRLTWPLITADGLSNTRLRSIQLLLSFSWRSQTVAAVDLHVTEEWNENEAFLKIACVGGGVDGDRGEDKCSDLLYHCQESPHRGVCVNLSTFRASLSSGVFGYISGGRTREKMNN